MCRRAGYAAAVALLALAGTAPDARAQGDNFADAIEIAGEYGSTTLDSTGFSAEFGEPSHAGSPANATAWFKWTAPDTRLVQFDTYGSAFNTVLGVYTGPSVDRLNQMAANDDATPSLYQGGAQADPSANTITLTTTVWRGPSMVRFNARAGQTYHIAVGASGGAGGSLTLSWAYDSAGVFRFSSDAYQVSENDGLSRGSDPAGSTRWSPLGSRVTVTRVGGARGRVTVDFTTGGDEDTAVADEDYTAVTRTLIFDDWEMSKSVIIPIRSVGACQLSRAFTVTLSNPQFDPMESVALLPPRIDPGHSAATVNILDYQGDPASEEEEPCSVSARGIVNFERSTYRVREDVGTARIYVKRWNGADSARIAWGIDSDVAPPNPLNLRDNIRFALEAGSDYATPDPFDATPASDEPADFYPSNDPPSYGVLSWGQNDNNLKAIEIPIYDDSYTEFNEDLRVRLYYIPAAQDNATIGMVGETTITILFDEYPAGAVDDTHNRDYALLTDPPRNTAPGTDSTVYGAVVQPTDGKTVIVGDFTQFNAQDRNRIARMNVDGQNDGTFNPRGGADQLIAAVALDSTGKIVIGGDFTSYDGQDRYRVARLNTDGSLDGGFNPGAGVDNTVWAVAVQPDDKVIIAGAFSTVWDMPRAYIARLNADGSLDESFNPTNLLNGTVHSVALAPDGTILVGGEFTMAGEFNRSCIARLRTDGSLDPTFNPRTGVAGGVPKVRTLGLQSDGRILIGGEFEIVDLRARRNIARLNTDGTLDESFDPGTGTDDTVYTITVQPDGRIFIGGIFVSYNETRRMGLARLFADGRLDTSFLDTAYNQFAGFCNPYFDEGLNPRSYLFTTALQADGDLIVGGGFHQVGGGRINRDTQTNLFDFTQTDTGEDRIGTWGYSRAAFRSRYNVARLLGGDTDGPGNVGLVSDSYSVNESQQYLFVRSVRTDGTLGWVENVFSLPPREAGPGVAETTTDYVYNRINPAFPTSWRHGSHPTRNLADGIFETNNIGRTVVGSATVSTLEDIYVTIPRRLGIEGDRTAPMMLSVPSCADVFFLGGDNVPLASALGRRTAELKINDVDKTPGVIGFASAEYSVTENGVNAIITLTRTNGSFGDVSVRFATTNGSGIHGVDYTGVTNRVTFRSGVTVTNFSVPIINRDGIQPEDRTVFLQLSQPAGPAGAVPGLGLTNATLFIVDDDYEPGRLNLTSTAYVTNETAGAVRVTVTRSGGNLGTMDVSFRTVDGSALAGVNYTGVTNILHWDSLDATPRHVDIPLLADGLVTSNRQFAVQLYNPTVVGSLGSRSNAPVTILNQDFFGNLQFSAPTYIVNEQGGYATLSVVRVGGSAETLSVNFNTSDATAVSGGVLPNFVATNSTLTFGPGELIKSFTVPILNDGVPNGTPFYFAATLSGLTPAGAGLGTPSTAQVRIVDAQTVTQPAGGLDPNFSGAYPLGFNDDVFAVALQPNGKVLAGGSFTSVNGLAQNRLARLLEDGTTDTGFLHGLSGANATVRSVISQTDTRVVVGGAFTTFNGVNRRSLVRLNFDGTLDTTFNPGSGADGLVYALAESFPSGGRKLYAGGSFNTFNGVTSPRIVRLNDDGTMDGTFNVLGLGANDVVYAVAVYPTNTVNAGKVLIGGDFTQVNGVARARIARLNVDGSLDTTFNPGSGADGVVRALAIQADGKILVGGSFATLNGTAASRIARLNANGSVDTAFMPGPGCNDVVYGISLQADNRIVLVGDFTRANGVSRSRITRLLPNGAVDPTINFGTGANAFIAALAIQPDGKLVIGGGFTEVQGIERNRIARLFGSAMTGSGQLEFTSPVFVADENGTNVLVKVRRLGGTTGTGSVGTGDVTVKFATSDGTAVSGVNYAGVTNLLAFPVGEVLQEVVIPVTQDFQITPDLTVNLALSEVSAPATLGPQPTAVVTIRNVDSGVSFAAAEVSVSEDDVAGAANIRVIRSGSSRGTSAVLFETTFGGTAVPGLNFQPVTTNVTFLPGETEKFVKIPVLRDPAASGNRTVTMQLTEPLNALIFAPSQATLTIIDVDRAPGQLFFASPAFAAGEGDGQAVITVQRTNGYTGIVSVNFATVPGTALPGLKYVTTNGVLTFADGELAKSFGVRILENTTVEGDQAFSIALSNPTGGATLLGSSNAVVTILDNDVGVTFSSPAYVVAETAPAVFVNVVRLNASNLVTTLTVTTVNGTAHAGTNYTALHEPLTFNPGESVKSVSIPILRDPRVTGNLNFAVLLTNASPGVQLVAPNPATVVVVDADSGLHLSAAEYTVSENASNLVVSVIRSNASGGLVTVNYSTADDSAVNGVDYVSASGQLTFEGGETVKTFSVPILDNTLVQSDRSFLIELFNAGPGAQLLPPTSAVATIVDNDAGLRFSTASYTILENEVLATITVVRTNFINSLVSVDYTTADGTALAGTDYYPTNGTLVFAPGETNQSFTVVVLDDNVVKGDRTILLKLLNPTGDASIISPAAATLTVYDNDGSLIVPAGSALITETNSNGVIDPGELVTLLFAFRNSAGTNALNVTATLLATNGVMPTTTSQNYGPLPVNGPGVSRPFTFRATATNGQSISATFRLADGATDLGLGTFNFTVGTSARSYSNAAPITINDTTNNSIPAAASPYPSTIAVSGVDGLIERLTVTVSNLTHGSVGDVGALLVSPTGQRVVLMANAGGLNPVSQVTLTFDDQAAAGLPLTSFTSGQYKPTTYPTVPPFVAPAPPGAYGSTLAAFTGSNPNGSWSLYLVDDLPFFGGAISNGWRLSFVSSKPVGSAADLSLTMHATPEPVVAGSNVTYTLLVTNHGPSAAAGVTLSNALPEGVSFVAAAPAQGSAGTNASGAVIWSVGALAKDATASLTLMLQPAAVGEFANSAHVASETFDANPANNTATVASTVVVPTADLAMGLTDDPDPIATGYPLVYTMSVTNLGPATAVDVNVTNTLPPGVEFLSLATSQGAGDSAGDIVWVALGDLSAGAQATVTVVARPWTAGTITDVATAVSSVLDPLKGNNTASVKTIVETQIGVRRTAGGLEISHPAVPGTILESTPSLVPPILWSPVQTNPPSPVTLPVTNGTQFFRLRPPGA